MMTSTSDVVELVVNPVTPTAPNDAVTALQPLMLKAAMSASDVNELLRALTQAAARYATPATVTYRPHDRADSDGAAVRVLAPANDNPIAQFAPQLDKLCESTRRSGRSEIQEYAMPALVLIAAPIGAPDTVSGTLGVMFPGRMPTDQLCLIVQMMATHVLLWHSLADSRRSESDAQSAAALIELLRGIEATPDFRHTCNVLADELKTILECHSVVVALQHGRHAHCRVAAISGVANFDRKTSRIQAIESACFETLSRDGDSVAVWPPQQDDQRHNLLAHKNLCNVEEGNSVVTAPLRDADGKAVGVVMALFHDEFVPKKSAHFLAASAESLAASLKLVWRAEGTRAARLLRRIGRFCRSRWGLLSFVAMVLVAFALTRRMPYRIACDCKIEPVTRRYIAAPFEGTLDKSLVKPGDVVQEDQVVARIDGREIRWKRAEVQAERNAAVKRRDAAQATGNYAEAQIATLEMKRLDLQLEVLDHRADHLEIKSPIAGVIASGELERAEGAPLSVGQTLFEVAPLEEIIVEVGVVDDEVSFVAEGQQLEVRLDAYPDETWKATVLRLHPRSEIRWQDNVFVAEAVIDNRDGRLRPGMKGRAKVVTESRTVGWILFHKPWDYLTKLVRW